MPKPTTLPDPEDNSFGARLIRFRASLKITREDLKEQVLEAGHNTTVPAIRNWETKGQTPRGELYRYLITVVEKAGY